MTSTEEVGWSALVENLQADSPPECTPATPGVASSQREPKSQGACRKIFSACQTQGKEKLRRKQTPFFLHGATLGASLDNLPANVGKDDGCPLPHGQQEIPP